MLSDYGVSWVISNIILIFVFLQRVGSVSIRSCVQCSGHTLFIQRRINVDATSCHDVASTLMRRCINVMRPLGMHSTA